MNVALSPNGDPASQGGGANIPTFPNKKQNQDTQGRQDVGMEAQNAYMTSLFDPGAYTKAKVTILGDPDYLVQETPASVNQVYNQFYGSDGFTINPNGGQVFIEIDFKEAVDYTNSDGLLNINESIYFWNYPAAVANKVKGVSYMVLDVEHSFKSGKFQQTLTCCINDFPGVLGTPAEALGGRANITDKTAARTGLTLSKENANNARSAFAASDPRRVDLGGSDIRTGTNQGGDGPTPGKGSTTSASSGYTPDNEFAGVDEAIAQQANAALLANARGSVLINNQTSPTGGSNANGAPFAGAGTAAENNAGQQTNTGVIVPKDVANDDATINTITSRQAAVFNQDDGREIPEDTRGNRSV
jgi:hypothetical protein